MVVVVGMRRRWWWAGTRVMERGGVGDDRLLGEGEWRRGWRGCTHWFAVLILIYGSVHGKREEDSIPLLRSPHHFPCLPCLPRRRPATSVSLVEAKHEDTTERTPTRAVHEFASSANFNFWERIFWGGRKNLTKNLTRV